MATVTLPYPQPADTGQYAEDQLAALQAPDNPTNLAVISAWDQAESATFPGYNGLGTTLALPGSTPVPGNSAGVQLYPNLQEGLQAGVDMMLGQGPQTTPLATQFVKDLRSGSADEQTLVNDIYNSGWAGSGPDTYDGKTVAALLQESSFTPAGQAAAQTGPATTSFSEPFPGGSADPLNIPTEAAASAASSIGSTAKTLVFEGLAALAGIGLVILGVRSAGATQRSGAAA